MTILDLARAAKLAKVPHEQRNGDSAHQDPDSLEKVKRDFPELFPE